MTLLAPTPPGNLAKLSMDVPYCLVSSGISLWSYSEIGKIEWEPVSLAVEVSWRFDGPSWYGQPGEGCGPRSWHLGLLESSLFSSSLTLSVLLLMILTIILAQGSRYVFSGDPVYTTVAVLLLLLIIGITVIIWRQPQNPSPLTFRVGDLMCPKCPPWVKEICVL